MYSFILIQFPIDTVHLYCVTRFDGGKTPFSLNIEALLNHALKLPKSIALQRI